MDANLEIAKILAHISPSLSGFVLGYANHQHGEPTEKNVGSDPIRQAVIDRTYVHEMLQVAKDALDLEELLVTEDHVVDRKAVIGCAQEIFAVQAFLRLDLLLVEIEVAILVLKDVPAEDFVAAQRASGRMVKVVLENEFAV